MRQLDKGNVHIVQLMCTHLAVLRDPRKSLNNAMKIKSHYHRSQYQCLSHTRENTANQKAGKPLYIRQYSTDPSHNTVRQFAVFSLAWDKIVIQ